MPSICGKRPGVAYEASLTLVGRARKARNSSVLKLWGPRSRLKPNHYVFFYTTKFPASKRRRMQSMRREKLRGLVEMRTYGSMGALRGVANSVCTGENDVPN